jgi:hypothetical protein
MNANQLTVFLEYTRRFEEIAAELPTELRDTPTEFDRSYQNKKDGLSDHVQHAIVRYVNLCSEEFFLHGEGLITEPVWELWRSYMEAVLGTALFTDAWGRIRRRYDAQKPFQSFVDGIVGYEPTHAITERRRS